MKNMNMLQIDFQHGSAIWKFHFRSLKIYLGRDIRTRDTFQKSLKTILNSS